MINANPAQHLFIKLSFLQITSKERLYFWVDAKDIHWMYEKYSTLIALTNTT